MSDTVRKIPDCPRCCTFPRSTACAVMMAGSFKRASREAPIRRYLCFDCGKGFSEATLTREYRQRKRHLNDPLFKLLSSCVSMRRSAKLLGTARRTVERRLPYLAQVALDHHNTFLASRPPVQDVHFDDMESWIHTKLKPVSIPLAVEHPQRLILAFDVVSMPAKGRLAKKSLAKYGKRADHRRKGWQHTLSIVNQLTNTKIINITSDSHSCYSDQIRLHIANANHIQVKGRRGCVVGQGELKRGGQDPLFSLNQTAAMFRANVNRLVRRTWCTSKTIENLKCHMKIYTLWHNETIMAKLEQRPERSPFKGLC